MDLLDQLKQGAEAVSTVAQGVRTDQTGLPTPCSEWDVSALMNHMIGAYQRFAARAEGKDVGQLAPAEPASLEQAKEWLAASASQAAAGWALPGVLERKVQTPFGELDGRFMAGITLTELVMHGWDLARATGQPMPLDEGLASSLLQSAQATIRPEARQSAFGPEQPAPAGAPALDQLAAFLGRKV